MTAKELLLNNKNLSSFIVELQSCNLLNYRNWGFNGIYRNGILIVMYDYSMSGGKKCLIYVASDKNTRVDLSSDIAAFVGDYNYVRVYDCGEWVKEGPWQRYIEKLLEDLIYEKNEKERMDKILSVRKQQELDKNLLKTWSN